MDLLSSCLDCMFHILQKFVQKKSSHLTPTYFTHLHHVHIRLWKYIRYATLFWPLWTPHNLGNETHYVGWIFSFLKKKNLSFKKLPTCFIKIKAWQLFLQCWLLCEWKWTSIGVVQNTCINSLPIVGYRIDIYLYI